MTFLIAAEETVTVISIRVVLAHNADALPQQCTANAEVASVYGGSDGVCGYRTANGGRLNCAAMTAAHRTLPFGTLVQVCHNE